MIKKLIEFLDILFFGTGWVKRNPDVDLNGGSASVKPEAIKRKIKELKKR